MEKPLLHKLTESKINSLLNKPGHGYLFSGPSSSGKMTTIKWIAAKLQGAVDPKSYHIYVIEPAESGSIGIESAKSIEQTIGKSTDQRYKIVAINHAHKMTHEAQNSLLKTIEEPAPKSIIILSTDKPYYLLPTIRSRLNNIAFHRIAKKEIKQTKFGLSAADDFEKLYHMGNMTVGGLKKLLEDNEHKHSLLANIKIAKEFLASSDYERMVSINAHAKDKSELEQFLNTLHLTCWVALKNTSMSDSISSAKSWAQRIEAIDRARQLLIRNVNPKLISDQLVVEL